MLLFISTFYCLKHAARKDPVFESWLHGQSRNIVHSLCSKRNRGQNKSVFSAHVMFFLSAVTTNCSIEPFRTVSVFSSLHTFSRQISSNPPGFPWRQKKPSSWILKDSCSRGYSTFWQENDPPRKKSEWKKKILLECTSTFQEVTSVVLRSQLKACPATTAQTYATLRM